MARSGTVVRGGGAKPTGVAGGTRSGRADPHTGHSISNQQLTPGLRVAIVDSDQSFHEFVRRAVQAHAKGWDVKCYESPDSLLAALRHGPTTPVAAQQEAPTSAHDPLSPATPDVVLIEALWPGLSGIGWLRKLMALLPKPRIVMSTACADHDTIAQSLIAGALGYLLKPVAPAYLVWALNEAARGRPVLCGEAQAAVMDLIRRINAGRRWKRLSGREREIMVLLIDGATSGEIATKLSISQATADWHVNNILKKTHVHSRDQARRKFVGGGEFLLSGGGLKTHSFPSCMFSGFA